MKIFRPLYQFCSKNITSLTNYKHFTQIEAKQLLLKPNQLRDSLLEHIDRFGQLPIQRYWKTALTDSQFGYYGKKNVFSRQGDFTTSPEISPLFGQMIAIWIVYFLKKTKIYDEESQQIVKKFRIVQLGGGRGLLMKDIIRTFSDVKINNNFDISFVEVSQYNRKAQQHSLMDQFKKKQHFFKFQHQKSKNFELFTSQNPQKNVSMLWISSIQELYQMDMQKQKNKQQIPFTIYVMNEFMDALPVTILKYTESGWRQKVLKKSSNPELYFQLKTSDRELHQKMKPIGDNFKKDEQMEVSHISLLTIDLLAKSIQKYGGAILNIDYGDEGAFSNSIRAIKDHKYIPDPYFWSIPGQCDLSAYVNFGSLAQFAQKNEGIIAYEAIPQGYFLESMGIVPRVDNLKKNLKQQQQNRLQSEYQRLVLPSEMGEVYKVQIITLKQYGEIYPHIQENQYSF